MRSVALRGLALSVLMLWMGITSGAQQAPAAANDPRVGLKPGFKDAGVAARNMELVSSMAKPEGFFDPKDPLGPATPPEAPPTPAPSGTAAAPAPTPAPATPAAPAAATAAPAGPPARSGLDFANSDLAFSGNHVIMGNFNGFNTYDIENTRRPRLLASIVCPGGQGDVSIHGNLLFMSVEQTRGRIDCGTQGNVETASKERFRGIRIFDISDLKKPKQLAAVQTCRGSHTHTLVTDPKDKANI